MDFEFSDEQEQLRDAVRRWVDKDFGFERRHALAKAGGFTRAVLGELNGLGLAGLLLGWAYSAPPLKLVSRGLGEPAVAASWLAVIVGAESEVC